MEVICEECVRLRSESRAIFTNFVTLRDKRNQLPIDSPQYSGLQAAFQTIKERLREAHKREDSHRRSIHGARAKPATG
jgi:hypothetical protein